MKSIIVIARNKRPQSLISFNLTLNLSEHIAELSAPNPGSLG